MLRIALTGGIASGKSTAAAAFRDLGVPVIDTDRIARDAVKPGMQGLAALVDEFGDRILDASGALDRARLRDIIFTDTASRKRVNAILHPLILAGMQRALEAVDAPYVIIEIPLLAETGLAHAFDRVLVVDAADDVRVQRVMARDGVSEAQARAAQDAQATHEERLRLADDIVENDGSPEDLRAAIRNLHARYVAEAGRFASTPIRPAE